MTIVKNILGRFFAFWALLWFVVTMLLILLPTWLLGLVKEPRRTVLFIQLSRIWMGVWLPLAGIRLKIKGREKFKQHENYVVVCNHNSFMDVPVTSPGIPSGNKTIAKIEMAKIPLFGIVYRRGSVLVDRKSEESRLKSYAYMKKVLDIGLHMCIYPEGTRNKTDQPLKEFKEGAFRLAIETKKPIIPAVLFNTRNVLPQHKTFYFWPSAIEMHFLDPVETHNLETKDVKALKEKVFSMMWNYIEQNK
ncbi:MAG: 1-acyl-sn-glycerol-3-phosphate acyltransferase [Chitinophagaceae bacterium]|jgi:1-acyl-sn-glycerol-3-phosphate acyltransferase|nr:1-acyl-sn-glycerol-3-phosphate acyltransferase [Chitinophagaceae bacterium]